MADVPGRHRIQFPPADVRELGQDEVYFYLVNDEGRERIRLHAYDRMYEVPGLYEQVVYDRLQCQSPEMVVDVLRNMVAQSGDRLSSRRVLDLGAGNMVGAELQRHGVSRLIGVDIIEQAELATDRDHPGVYDAYYVMDFTALSERDRSALGVWAFDTLVCVAALGFGDIPVRAFIEAFNLVSDDGFVAFNIKETFFDRSDTSGFSLLIRELILSRYLTLHILQRYRHRYSIEGEPLYYYAIAGRKRADVPPSFATSLEA